MKSLWFEAAKGCLDIETLRREQTSRIAPHEGAFKRARTDANNAIKQLFTQVVARSRELRERQRNYEKLSMSHIIRMLRSDEEQKQARELFVREQQSLVALPKQSLGGCSLDLKSKQLCRLGNVRQLDLVPEDTVIDIFAPPYADQWTDMEPSPSNHQQQQAWADKNDGTFGFLQTIGSEGGWAHSAGAVWVEFVPRIATGTAQVRAYCPYQFIWRDQSYVATAHNDAGFGVLVLSWDMNGNNWNTDQDFRYATWSDGTSWYDDDHNASFPDPDYGHAYYITNEPPYFAVQSSRVYMAAIWCFGSCDASGAEFVDASYAQNEISAMIPFVAIGYQAQP